MNAASSDILNYAEECATQTSFDGLTSIFRQAMSDLDVHEFQYLALAPFFSHSESFELGVLPVTNSPNFGIINETQISVYKELISNLQKKLRSINASKVLLGKDDAALYNKFRQLFDTADNIGFVICPVFGAHFKRACFILAVQNDALESHVVNSLRLICDLTHTRIVELSYPKLQIAQTLSAREKDILSGLSEGLSNNQIASKFNISPYTVNGYVKRVFLKTGTKDRTTAVLFGLASGLIS